jgi:arylsulfatase A-like enzyme
VPLVIVLPKLWPRIAQRIDRRVSLASLAPTIYGFAGIDCSSYSAAFAGYPLSLATMITSPPSHTGRATPPPSARQQLTREAAESEKAMRSLGYIQ